MGSNLFPMAALMALTTLSLAGGALAQVAAASDAAAAPPGVGVPANTASAVAAEQPASDESIRNLLELLHVRDLLAQITGQMDLFWDQQIKQMLGDRVLSEQQQQSVRRGRNAMRALRDEMLDWNALEAMYVRVYSSTFTQAEVDGMTAYYHSPVGQAVNAKMPVAMGRAMSEIQQRVQSLLPRVQKMAQEAAEQVKAAEAPPPRS